MEDQDYPKIPQRIDNLLNSRRFVETSTSENRDTPKEVQTKFYDETLYSTVYHGLTTHFKLERPIETLILAFILSFTKKRNWCWCSQDTIAAHLGVSIPTIGSGLEELSKKELIEQGGRHPKYNTIQWKASVQTLDYLKYLQEKMDKKEKERKEYKKSKEQI